MSLEASGHSPVETICESTVKLIPYYCLGIEKVNNCASYSLLGKMIKIRQSTSRIKQDIEELRVNILGTSIVPILDILSILLSSLPMLPQLKPDIHVLTILVVHINVNADHCNEFYSSYSKSLGLLLLGETES